MIYCLSDIHGEKDRFDKMLELIDFSSKDTMYILGDAIDRGPYSIDIIRHIMQTPNIQLLLGNHEDMLLQTFVNPLWRKMWISNGGSKTYHELVYMCDKTEREEIINFLRSVPDHLDIEVNGIKYHLVHGYPADKRDDKLWSRPNPGEEIRYSDKTVILGHTPTEYYDNSSIFNNELMKIYFGKGFINLDCGCGHKSERARLGCLRLDDLKEFYI